MNDPTEWSKKLSPERRRILESARQVSAPATAKKAMWSALAAELPGAAAATGAGTATLTKVLVVGLAIGGAGLAGMVGLRALARNAPTSVPSAVPSVSTKPELPTAPLPIQSSTPRIEPAPAAEPTRDAESVARVPSVNLRPRAPHADTGARASSVERATEPAVSGTLLESQRMAAARASLRAGDAQRTLLELEALARDYPAGVLTQERDALRIQALSKLGERKRARDLARSFLGKHPGSPHAEAVRRVLE
jgi:hypothetical protein